jgi:hypothetical protein
LGTYDVKNLAATGTTIPITINNGLSYTMDVRFDPIPEPSSLALAVAGALAVGAWGVYNLMRGRKEEKDLYEVLSNSA